MKYFKLFVLGAVLLATTSVYAHDWQCLIEPTCESIGYNDAVINCPGDYIECPFSSSKGICIYEARPGDLKYSLRTGDHNGWLLCDGGAYNKVQYPELYEAIKDSFGANIPNYTGYYIKSTNTSSGSTLASPEEASVPNITGTMFIYGVEGAYSSVSGAFTMVSSGDHGCGHKKGGQSPTFYFDASKYNEVFGRSATVTPYNYKVNIFIYAGKNMIP